MIEHQCTPTIEEFRKKISDLEDELLTARGKARDAELALQRMEEDVPFLICGLKDAKRILGGI